MCTGNSKVATKDGKVLDDFWCQITLWWKKANKDWGSDLKSPGWSKYIDAIIAQERRMYPTDNLPLIPQNDSPGTPQVSERRRPAMPAQGFFDTQNVQREPLTRYSDNHGATSFGTQGHRRFSPGVRTPAHSHSSSDVQSSGGHGHYSSDGHVPPGRASYSLTGPSSTSSQGFRLPSIGALPPAGGHYQHNNVHSYTRHRSTSNDRGHRRPHPPSDSLLCRPAART
ncbi:hypothetical protein B0H10DRAFT_2062206, partial [Mycena sp. CBHHK59/15]